MTDQAYWLRRKRASVSKAHMATSAEARLAHFDLAGRYSVKAVNCDPCAEVSQPEIDEAQIESPASPKIS